MHLDILPSPANADNSEEGGCCGGPQAGHRRDTGRALAVHGVRLADGSQSGHEQVVGRSWTGR